MKLLLGTKKVLSWKFCICKKSRQKTFDPPWFHLKLLGRFMCKVCRRKITPAVSLKKYHGFWGWQKKIKWGFLGMDIRSKMRKLVENHGEKCPGRIWMKNSLCCCVCMFSFWRERENFPEVSPTTNKLNDGSQIYSVCVFRVSLQIFL